MSDAARTGLVLGGGGVTGIAWMLGVLQGLRTRGVDLTGADTVIGTSAGSVVGAQVTSPIDLEDLYAEQTRPADSEIGAEFGPRAALTLMALLLVPGDGRSRRRRIGQAAQKAHPGPATERLRVIGDRLRTADGRPLSWPDRDLRITAVDADSGGFRVFDGGSGVDLVHAVAASCAVPLVWPAVEIDGHRYVDGGMRSPANADLATGCDVVVALAPLARSVHRHHRLPTQLRRSGAKRFAVVSPDADSLTAIGRNVLDPAKRQGAARAGLAQGAALAAEMQQGWPA